MIIQANTPEETKHEIIKWLQMNASNHRIAASKSSRVAIKVENTTLAAAYQGAVDFLKMVQFEGHAPKSNLYRVQYINGYIVYRHCFDEKNCDLTAGILAHKQATFVQEDQARHFAKCMNALIDDTGSDALNA